MDREITVGLEIAGEPFAMQVETRHAAGVTARTAIHRMRADAHRMGGVRFVVRSSLEESAHLALGMAEKTAACGFPLDGHKCVVSCPQGLPDEEARAEILADHLRVVVANDPRIIVGPDMGSSESLLDRVAEAGLIRYVTGLSERLGGLEIDRRAYTALGIVEAAEAALGGLAGARVSVEGFGAVGGPTTWGMEEKGASVVAVSCALGTLEEPTGLRTAELRRLRRHHGDGALEVYARQSGTSRFSPDPGRLFEIETDVFVPAARTVVLCAHPETRRAAAENPDVRPVEDFYSATGLRCLIEAANHPLTRGAESFLADRGVLVLPDVLVNSGGMIGCYFEWLHRSRLLGSPAARPELDASCRDLVRSTVRRNVAEILAHRGDPRRVVELRLAATVLRSSTSDVARPFPRA